jgi:hypothetical protein
MDVRDVRAFKAKDDPPIAGNRNAPETAQVSGERMQPQTRKIHIRWFASLIQIAQDSANLGSIRRMDARRIVTLMQQLQSAVPEAADHA